MAFFGERLKWSADVAGDASEIGRLVFARDRITVVSGESEHGFGQLVEAACGADAGFQCALVGGGIAFAGEHPLCL